MIIKLHNNCIEIPQEVIHQSSLKEGDCLDCVFYNNAIYLIPISPLPEAIAPVTVESISPLYAFAYQGLIICTAADLYRRKSVFHRQQKSA